MKFSNHMKLHFHGTRKGLHMARGIALLGLLSLLYPYALASQDMPNAENNQSNSAPSPKAFTTIIESGQAKGGTQTLRVTKGSEVVLEFLSDTDGVVHLHAYHLALDLRSNQAAQLKFTAKASGKFKVEWHPKLKDASLATAAAPHEGAPLLSLEVMPL